MLIIQNASVYTGTGDILNNQTIVIQDGVFQEIKEQANVSKRAKTIDAKGKLITPGFIDVHTHLGVHEQGVGHEGADFNEIVEPLTPEVRALDGINPREMGFEDARKSGITTVQVMPGSANILGGEMLILKTLQKNVVDDMVIKAPSGMKSALGENPKRQGPKSSNQKPTTRMGIAAKLRAKLMEAQDYLQEQPTKRDLGLEHLTKVLKKEIPLRVHAHRADDIITALRIKQEFDIDMTIEHCTEGHLIADHIAEHDVHVSVGPTMSTRSKVELKDKMWETLKILTDAGVSCSITTDHPVVGIEYLLFSAIEAVRHGLTKQQALQAITLNAAKHLGIERQVGSVEVGKDADFLIWNGDPFDPYTRLENVFINGTQVS